MTSLKNGLLVCSIGLFLQLPVQAISWQYLIKPLSVFKSSVLKIARPLGTYAQKTVAYLNNNRRKVAIISAMSAIAAVACYGLWRATRFDGLTTTDPRAFCDWAVGTLNSLDADRPYLEQAARTPRIVDRINKGYELTRAVSSRLFDILPRNLDERYEALQDRYQRTAQAAPLLEGPRGVHAFWACNSVQAIMRLDMLLKRGRINIELSCNMGLRKTEIFMQHCDSFTT